MYKKRGENDTMQDHYYLLSFTTMRPYIIATLAIALFCTMVTSLSIPLKDMSDNEIAKLLITNKTVSENEGGMYLNEYMSESVLICIFRYYLSL